MLLLCSNTVTSRKLILNEDISMKPFFFAYFNSRFMIFCKDTRSVASK